MLLEEKTGGEGEEKGGNGCEGMMTHYRVSACADECFHYVPLRSLSPPPSLPSFPASTADPSGYALVDPANITTVCLRSLQRHACARAFPSIADDPSDPSGLPLVLPTCLPYTAAGRGGQGNGEGKGGACFWAFAPAKREIRQGRKRKGEGKEGEEE